MQPQSGLFDLTLFDITTTQRVILNIAQFIPAIITRLILHYYNDLLITAVAVVFYYFIFSIVYITLISKQQEFAPYLINEFRKLREQFNKGFTLGFSAFLLITIYGIIILKIGKIVLPQHLDLGQTSRMYWPAFFVIAFVNPLLQEWFWRLLLPKTLRLTFITNHVLNISYLLYHFSLFSYFLGFWRSIPLVGTFYSVGRSMTHIKSRYGIISAVITHYGITISGIAMFGYVQYVIKAK